MLTFKMTVELLPAVFFTKGIRRHCDTYPKVVIDGGEFCVSKPSSFVIVEAHTPTHGPSYALLSFFTDKFLTFQSCFDVCY